MVIARKDCDGTGIRLYTFEGKVSKDGEALTMMERL